MPKSKARIGLTGLPSKADFPTVGSLVELFADCPGVDEGFMLYLVEIITVYLWMTKSREASTKEDLVDDLVKLRTQTKRVKKHISTTSPPTTERNYSTSDHTKLKSEFDGIVLQHFQWSKITPDFPHIYWTIILEAALDGMYAIIDNVLFLAKDEQFGGFDEVEGWDIFVTNLTELMKSYNLPFKVSKATGARPSPFVELIWNLQELLPAKARKHNHSKEALAAAIVQARRRRVGKAVFQPMSLWAAFSSLKRKAGTRRGTG
jgi:hypothetical protein